MKTATTLIATETEGVMGLRVGDRIHVFAPIDYQPYATIEPGERGTVVDADPVVTYIELDKKHPGLSEWDNRIALIAEGGDTTEIENAIELLKDRGPAARRAGHCLVRLAAMGLLCMILGATVSEALDLPEFITSHISLWED